MPDSYCFAAVLLLWCAVLLDARPSNKQDPAAAPTPAAAAGPSQTDERAAQHAAAVATATAVLSEASASALRDVLADEGISEEQRAEQIAKAREKRMQDLLYAITVLASSSGKRLREKAWLHGVTNKVVCSYHQGLAGAVVSTSRHTRHAANPQCAHTRSVTLSLLLAPPTTHHTH